MPPKEEEPLQTKKYRVTSKSKDPSISKKEGPKVIVEEINKKPSVEPATFDISDTNKKSQAYWNKKTKKELEEVLAGLGIEIPAQTRTKRVKGKMVTEQVDKINKKELLRMVREAVY